MVPVIFHIPHASKLIPRAVREDMLITDAELASELIRMTDAWTDQLMVSGLNFPATTLVCPVSRLVVDVERFPEDDDEPMAVRGMGAVYTHLSTGQVFRNIDSKQRWSLMDAWYRPHHTILTRVVDDALDRTGKCLIIDIHSFSSAPLPHEFDQDPNRPELCIGIEGFHSPFRSEMQVINHCKNFGFVAEVNRPFSGSIVPKKHWQANPGVKSFMVELRRDLYMCEVSGGRLDCFRAVANRLCELLNELVAEIDKNWESSQRTYEGTTG